MTILTGRWNMTGAQDAAMSPGEINIMVFADDGGIRMEKKRGTGDDLAVREAAFTYDEANRQLAIQEEGEVVAQFEVIELADSKLVMKMGPDVCTYEKVQSA